MRATVKELVIPLERAKLERRLKAMEKDPARDPVAFMTLLTLQRAIEEEGEDE